MSNMGWQENTGLGKDASGNAKHIAVVRKMDNGGIGMMRLQKEGKELSAGAGQAGAGLEDVLKRLAARASASASATPSAQPSPAASPAPSPGPSVVRNKIS
jgi:Pin2-interacting protein X1